MRPQGLLLLAKRTFVLCCNLSERLSNVLTSLGRYASHHASCPHLLPNLAGRQIVGTNYAPHLMLFSDILTLGVYVSMGKKEHSVLDRQSVDPLFSQFSQACACKDEMGIEFEKLFCYVGTAFMHCRRESNCSGDPHTRSGDQVFSNRNDPSLGPS
jgi:hypothetical protein